MKKLYRIFFLSLFRWGRFASAQTTQPDQKSLSKKQKGQQKIDMLDSLINKGKALEKVFHGGQFSNLSRSFNFILQSLVITSLI